MDDNRESSGNAAGSTPILGSVAFGDVLFDLRTGELHRAGVLAKLTPKAAALLAALIDRAPGLVTKEELFARVWDGRIVGDEALTSCIQELRRALGDDARRPRYIETRHRRGYRLILPAIGAALAKRTDSPLPILPDRPSIAVLPFQNMSGDVEQEYFTDGITEDIITELSRFRSLFVIARHSAFSYKGTSPDVRQIGRELGVRYVLEGSIRKSSNRVRVTGQLVDTLTGRHIWAERYDRVLEDIFAVQEEVTQAIVSAIAPQIDMTEQSMAARRRPDNLTAYEISLRGWAHSLEGIDKADRVLIDESIREAKEALTMDPACVLALNVLANAYGNALHLQMAGDRQHALQEAVSAATRAVEIDSTNSRGYALRALCVLHAAQVDRYSNALDDARHAHELNPNDTLARQVLGQLEAVAGEPHRAIEHLNQVLRLNPRQSRRHITYNMLAHASFGGAQYLEGTGWASRALNEMPEYPPPHLYLAICLVGMGKIDKAKVAFATGQSLAPNFFKTRLQGTPAYARPEDRHRADRFLRIAAGLQSPSAAQTTR